MKVYSPPADIPLPDPTVPISEYRQQVEQYTATLKGMLLEAGFTGPNTGRIYSTPRGDGYANYMFADAPRQSCLIHMQHGDAWHDPDMAFLPKKEVLKRIALQEKRPSIFRS